VKPVADVREHVVAPVVVIADASVVLTPLTGASAATGC
jgi:hypothetical protein